MDTFSSALMLWLGLTSLVPKPPTYEIEHFYTYNREHKQVALPLQKKVFLPYSQNTEVYVKKMTQKVERLTQPNSSGYIVRLENNQEAIELMNQLAKDGIPYQPVVRWEGVDAVPINRLLIQAKPFVTEKLIREWLDKNVKVKYTDVGRFEGTQNLWVVELTETVTPPNVLVLANQIAEDHAWTEWARVVFEPLYAPVSGSMEVTTPAVLNLGYDKQLDITIVVYKPTIKIRKDLLPKLGQNRFVPFPQKDDVWYDFGQTTITEEKTPEKTVIHIVTPFRFLMYGRIDVPPIQVAYDDGKEPGTFNIQGTGYNVQSVIKGTTLDDIQDMPVFPPHPPVAEPEKFSRVILPWQKVGYSGIGLGFGLMLVVCLVYGGRAYSRAWSGWQTKAENRKVWQELCDAPQAEGDWRKVYKDTERKLSRVLSKFYNTHVPVAPTAFNEEDYPHLHAVLVELEKLYKQTASPDQKLLAKQVGLFVRKSAAAYV